MRRHVIELYKETRLTLTLPTEKIAHVSGTLEGPERIVAGWMDG